LFDEIENTILQPIYILEGETKVQEPKPKVEVVDEEQEEASLEAAEGSEDTPDDLPMRSELEKEMKDELEERSKE